MGRGIHNKYDKREFKNEEDKARPGTVQQANMSFTAETMMVNHLVDQQKIVFQLL